MSAGGAKKEAKEWQCARARLSVFIALSLPKLHPLRPFPCQAPHEFAAALQSGGGVADLVTCSYSLTMIPDWRRAIDVAYALLRDGGQMAVADFLSWKQASKASNFSWSNWARHQVRTLPKESAIELHSIMARIIANYCDLLFVYADKPK